MTTVRGAPDLFEDRFARRRGRLSPAFLRVAEFIRANRAAVLGASAMEIARRVGTSDATVIRAVQALGFSGLSELRQVLAAGLGERDMPAANLRRTLAEAPESLAGTIDAALETFSAALEIIQAASFRREVEAAIVELRGRRIFVQGIGPTAHVVRYFAARLRRKGIDRRVLDRTGAELADQLLDLAPGDVVLMLAFGTPYREAQVTAAVARRHDVPLVLMTDTPDTELTRQARVVLPVPRGRSGRIALNAPVVLCLELLLIGLASAERDTALDTLERLEALRGMMRARHRPSGEDEAEPRP